MGSAGLTLPALEDFDVCPHLGFAAADVAVLPALNPYYKPWGDVLSQTTTLLASNRLRAEVRRLPLLRTDRLASNAERRWAYTTLAMLTQAYVFEDARQPTSDVPAVLSEPFLEICEYWGVQPILSHIGFCLWNWRTKDDVAGIAEARELLLQDLDNVESYGSFTSLVDEKVFGMVPLLVEAEGGSMVRPLLDALPAAMTGDTDTVLTTLDFCLDRLVAMSRHLRILHDRCDPHVFYSQIRQFIAGSQGMEAKGLPDGIVFELTDGRRIPSKCVGASAAQSSLFQFLDHVFGVDHKSPFLHEMRAYMPRKHRKFLEVVEGLPSLRSVLQRYPEHEALQTTLAKCLVLLREWRTKHIGLATRYVVMPARHQASKDGVKGTGGSLPIPFLKEARDETV